MRDVHVLIVEDESLVAAATEMLLLDLGYKVSGIVESVEGGLQHVTAVRPDLVLVDIELQGGGSGIDLALRLRKDFGIPVVYMTSYSDAVTIRKAVATEPFGYLVKPFDKGILSATLETAVCRMLAEERLARTERWLAATLESVSDAVIAVTGDFKVMLFNVAAERLIGLPASEVIGRSVSDVVRITSDSDEHIVEHMMGVTLADGTDIIDPTLRLYLHRRSGPPLPVALSISQVKDSRARISGLILVLRETDAANPGAVHLRQLDPHTIDATLEPISKDR